MQSVVCCLGRRSNGLTKIDHDIGQGAKHSVVVALEKYSVQIHIDAFPV